MMLRTCVVVLFISGIALAAEKPLAGAVIAVDPGHGGQTYTLSYTGGTTGVVSKLTEGDLNLRVSLELVKLLEADGATVHITRTRDHRLSRTGSPAKDELGSRVEFFEHHNCHFFLSVHHNAATEAATGHTAIYKQDAKEELLYKELAREVNDALAAAVPGPKRALIRGNYHLTRETRIPGTISEAGFLTNTAFDTLANDKDFPKKEAVAIASGATTYWRTHQAALTKLRDELSKARTATPKDPKTYANIQLNPEFQAKMKRLRDAVAPAGNYDAAQVTEYLTAFRKVSGIPATPLAAQYDGQRIVLSGKQNERAEHDAFIDLLVSMNLVGIKNTSTVPKVGDAAKE